MTELTDRDDDEVDDRYWTLFSAGIRTALIVHTCFILLFYLIGSSFLAQVNVGSVLLYLLCLKLVSQNRYNTVIILCCFELVLHAILAVKAIGWDSGFHYYMLMFIPLIFADSDRAATRKFGMLAIVCLAYILMDATMRHALPMTSVNLSVLAIIRFINIFVCFSFIGYVTYLYMDIVKHAHQKLFWYANTDPLTKLSNRRHLVGIMEYEEKQSERSNNHFSIVLADIDDFKKINDELGHEAGDMVLIEISDKLKSALRQQDSIARWGGEEFLVLLPETDISVAEKISKRIQEALSNVLYEYKDKKFSVTLSMGVAQHTGVDPIDVTIGFADAALYAAKRAGKNTINVSYPKTNEKLSVG